MPFGLCNALSIFGRLIELILKGLHWTICLIYRFAIIMERTFEEELDDMIDKSFIKKRNTSQSED